MCKNFSTLILSCFALLLATTESATAFEIHLNADAKDCFEWRSDVEYSNLFFTNKHDISINFNESSHTLSGENIRTFCERIFKEKHLDETQTISAPPDQYLLPVIDSVVQNEITERLSAGGEKGAAFSSALSVLTIVNDNFKRFCRDFPRKEIAQQDIPIGTLYYIAGAAAADAQRLSSHAAGDGMRQHAVRISNEIFDRAFITDKGFIYGCN